jgi:hypothetical protein
MLRSRAELLLEFCRNPDQPLGGSVLASYTRSASFDVPACDRLRPLGAEEVASYERFAGWALGLRLSAAQSQALARQIQEDWRQDDWVARPIADAIRIWGAVSRLSEGDRELMACFYRETYLRQITYSVLVGSEQLLKKFYEEQFPPLARGARSLYEPALRCDVTDAYAELICFQANAVLGKEAFQASAASKEAAARALASGYAEFSGRMKYALAAMPQMLAESKLAWPLFTDDDRRACREEWGRWLAPTQLASVSDAAVLVDRAVRKERSDDETWKKTPQAGMWEVIRMKAVSQRDQAQQNTFINAMRDRYGDAFEARYGSAPAW